MTRGRWGAALGVLAAVRVLVPLAALADSGHGLPGLPRYVYGYRGDASGYYSTARAILSGVPALGPALLPLLVLLAAGLWLAVRLWRRGRRSEGIVAAALAAGVVAAAVILAGDKGAVGAVGWPLLWAVLMAPLRVAGVISTRNAFGFGLVLSLAANVATLVAVAYAALWTTRRRGAALLAAALWAFWPLYIGLVAGHAAWQRGSWEVDTGLSMDSEPLSTACCTVALALLLRPRPTATVYTLAGLAAGYATLTRPSNGLLVLLAVGFVLARRGLRSAAPVVAGGLAALPVYVAFLPKRYGYGFSTGKGGAFVGLSVRNVATTFTDSTLWGARALGAILPPAFLGLFAVGLEGAVLLGGWVVLNTGFYSLAPNTWDQPRYLFAALPAALVLWAAGAWAVGEAFAARLLPGLRMVRG